MSRTLSSLCGSMRSSWEGWNAGLIPSLVQWLKDLALDPWPRNSVCPGEDKKEKKEKKKKRVKTQPLSRRSRCLNTPKEVSWSR